MSLVLGVEILGEYKQLTAATKGAQSQLSALNKRTQSIGNTMNKALAAIGIGFSFRIVTQQLEEAAKAAIDDSKSMQILALAMENTGKATAGSVKEAEKFIKKMQFSAAVADDELRPAYQKLFIATGDVTKSNKLLQIALDASAATGKSLDVVSQAMAKSLAGSDTALVKLIPSLKGVKDPIDAMGKSFEGAAEKAADLDPYARMEKVFQDMQEQIGMALLPTLQKFSDWLATPEGQDKFQKIVDGVAGVLTEFGKILQWAIENNETVMGIAVALGAIATAVKVLETVSRLQAGPINSNFAKMFGWVGLIATAIEGIKQLNELLGASTGAGQQTIGQQGFSLNSTASPSTGGSNMTFSTSKPKTTATKAPVTIVNNIKATQSAAQISATLNKQLKASGSSTIIRGGR